MSTRSRQLALAAALVAVAAVAPYAGSARQGFVFDDAQEVVRNTGIRSLDRVPRLFGAGAWSGAGDKNPIYRPLTSATYSINHALGGLDPFGYHLANLLLHACVSLLVLSLGLRLGMPLAAATIAAALFAVHPLHVEVAANVAGRKDALAAAFALLGVLAHDAAVREGGARAALPVLAILGAFFSKESGASALALIAAWDLIVAREQWKSARARALALYAAYAAAFGFYLWARTAAVGNLGAPAAQASFAENPLIAASPAEGILTAVAVLGRGLLLFVWPSSLSPDYSWDAIALVRSVGDPRFAIAVTALAALAGLAAISVRRAPANAFALALYGAAVLPASNLILPIGTIFGERLLYLPSAGLCLAIGAALSTAPSWIRAAAVASALAVAALGVRTATYAAVWKDDVTLFAHAVRSQPRSARAHQLYGEALAEAGRLDEATHELRLAVGMLSRTPEVPVKAVVELGVALEQQGRLSEARAEYGRLLSMRPDEPDALWRLGVVSWQQDDRTGAERLWQRAIAEAPGDARILSDLGLAAAARGDLQEAEALWRRATQADPNVAGPWLFLGNLAERRGDVQGARAAWERFLDNARYGAHAGERAAIAAKLQAAGGTR